LEIAAAGFYRPDVLSVAEPVASKQWVLYDYLLGCCQFLRSLGVLEHSSLCCCSNPDDGTLLLCISVYVVSVDVLTCC